MSASPNLWYRPAGGEEVVMHVADPWSALERLDVRFPPDPRYAVELAERNARWDAMQARKRATEVAAKAKPRGRAAK